ncbi:sugar ABC transporter substrate-binding protein [Mangrovactinospora gilvigrisea]|uniref:Sugar ABC transporter substrate-binding protein n=1 Tax=Mangrovactinospora gilvigrisea TaxID=1428644 RepID=A0A1J7BE04_9ACTN|nr:extracellular solute-binding protein [Mangrovactinospora gilvigrisea]OIV36862.1 sugar ABC transporter substrate-binding protein [Mangrovactinospora gilvigrisea]
MRRALIAAATLSALALTATACGSSGSGAGSTAAKNPGQVSGTITYWDTSDAKNEAPAYKALIKQFEAKYPKIKVQYQNVAFASVEAKFKSAAQSGKGAPDVVRTDVGLISEYASLGYAQKLDGTAALSDKGDFAPGAWGTTQYKGATYGIPQVTDTLGLLYNKALFKKAGIAKPPTTWDAFIADAKQLKARAGVDGTYLNPDPYFMLPFLFGEGADLADPAKKQITVNSPAAVKAATTAKKVADEASAKIDFANSYNNMQAMFKTGKVGMVIQGPWSTADDYSGSAFTDKANLGIAPVPAGSTGKGQAPTGGHDLVVYAGSKHLDASYLFTKFMTSSASEAFIAEKNGTLPGRTSAYTPTVLKQPSIAGFQAVLPTARARVALPQVGSLFTPLGQDYTKILQGQESPQAGLDHSAAEFKKLLPSDFTIAK